MKGAAEAVWMAPQLLATAVLEGQNEYLWRLIVNRLSANAALNLQGSFICHLTSLEGG